MKHFHMLVAALTILLFLWQSFVVLTNGHPLDKKAKILTHILYALIIGSGILLIMPLMSLNVPLQWVIAKIILLLAAISASIKAFRPTATHAQSKAGIFIALVAYIGILILAFVKPTNFI